jgi:DNA-binding response OmpR family regulator
MSSMRVLVVEDHRDIAESIGEFLKSQHHQVEIQHDGAGGYRRAASGEFDVIVLDRMLPRLDGETLCRRLRGEAAVATPVLMLTALDAVADKVAGFEAGADDYLAKPFALAELKVRLEALYRRAHPAPPGRRLQVADLTFDLDSLQATRAGRGLSLNPMTRRLLEALMRESPRVVTHEQLERALWGRQSAPADALRIHMHALRNAIDKPYRRKLLHSVHGVGYRLSTDET